MENELQISDKVLKINNKLPYIQLPVEKVNTFIEWYNEDLRQLKEIPEVFKEGYIELHLDNITKISLFSIFEVQNAFELDKITKLKEAFTVSFSTIIVYFKMNEDNKLDLQGFCGTNNHIFNYTINLKDDKFINVIRNYILGTATEKMRNDLTSKYEALPKVSNVIALDSRTREKEVFNERMTKFNRELTELCCALVISIIWYLATSKTEKYKVNQISNKFSNSNNTKKKSKIYTRKISNPIYDLTDRKEITVDRLIKRRNGWTISHSFQVRGHYRHYKNGKTVFIKSYEKGKNLETGINKHIIISPK